MKTLTVHTSIAKGVVDITDDVNSILKIAPVKRGLCHLFSPHTTAAITTVHLDSERDLDLMGAFEITLPKIMKRTGERAHTHFMSRIPSHIVVSLIGSSLAIPVKDRKLSLGDFQRLVLVQFNGPADREIIITY